MHNARYDDPKFPLKKPRFAYVIAGYLYGKCTKNYGKYDEDKRETYRFNIACQEHYNPGLDYDLIYVDNGSNDEEGIQFMKDHGRYFRRENEGFSFGAWQYAWNHLKDEYDYFLFTEDDHVPCMDNWLLEVFRGLYSRPGIGAVGNFIESRGRGSAVEISFFEKAGNHRDVMHNLDGGWTFTSAEVLRRVDQFGGLYVNKDYQNSTNEVIFQTPILEAGYSIAGFTDDDTYFVHGTSFGEPGPEIERDITHRTPLINCNARFFHPKLKELFSWYAP